MNTILEDANRCRYTAMLVRVLVACSLNNLVKISTFTLLGTNIYPCCIVHILCGTVGSLKMRHL
jgi:hypothetical protein